jgi:hypothetical protein
MAPAFSKKSIADLDIQQWGALLRASTADAAEDQRRKCDEIEINLCTSSQTVAGDIADYHSSFWTSVASLPRKVPHYALPAQACDPPLPQRSKLVNRSSRPSIRDLAHIKP